MKQLLKGRSGRKNTAQATLKPWMAAGQNSEQVLEYTRAATSGDVTTSSCQRIGEVRFR